MLQKEFPLHFEGVVVNALIWHSSPAVLVPDWAVDVRIPYAARGRSKGLGLAVPQARHGRPVRAVDLERQKIVAVDIVRTRRS